MMLKRAAVRLEMLILFGSLDRPLVTMRDITNDPGSVQLLERLDETQLLPILCSCS